MIELAMIFFVGAVFGTIISGAIAYDKGFSAGYNFNSTLHKSAEDRARELHAWKEAGNG